MPPLSSTDKQILLHIGYPKSASTTLQKCLFCKGKNSTFLGLYPRNNIGIDSSKNTQGIPYLKDSKLQAFYKYLHNSREYDPIRAIGLWRSIESTHASGKSSILLSHEALTAPFFSKVNSAEKRQRLKLLFPKAKILIVIRNQFDWLRSQYRDHPFDPDNLTSGEAYKFNQWTDKVLSGHRSSRVMEALNYVKVIKSYEKDFGKGNVNVLLFEELTEDLPAFSQKMAEFLGEEYTFVLQNLQEKRENKGVSEIYNKLRRKQRKDSSAPLIDKIIVRLLNSRFIKSLPQQKYTYNHSNQILINSLFSSGNRELATYRNLDLTKHGYPV